MERYDDGFAEERQRIERLVEEIIAGEHKIDKLPNSSAGFSGAAQAEYFSKARYHLESDVSNLIVNHKQQLDELQLLKMIKDLKFLSLKNIIFLLRQAGFLKCLKALILRTTKHFNICKEY